jgi:hypothetical protein
MKSIGNVYVLYMNFTLFKVKKNVAVIGDGLHFFLKIWGREIYMFVSSSSLDDNVIIEYICVFFVNFLLFDPLSFIFVFTQKENQSYYYVGE